MRFLITGCAGFIGSALADRLLAQGLDVVGYDNLSTGQERFLETARAVPQFRFVRGDVLDAAALQEGMQGCDFVFHLAANADVRYGLDHPGKDLEQNTIATHAVLECMRRCDVKRIAFASTGSIYGEASTFPTPENAPFPVQTSLYGASKLAGEGLIAAYSAGFEFQSYIFRIVSILGERYSHGHVFDFCRQLRTDPNRLAVLGDGRQRKSYLYVQDCVDAMLLAIDRAHERVNIFNLGHDGLCEVRESIAWICEALNVSPTIEYAGGERGWIGDSPFIHLDNRRIRALGWQPSTSIRDGVIRTVRYLHSNAWLLSAR